jgi:glycosyltransferase involved in cell wall biosynthesis
MRPLPGVAKDRDVIMIASWGRFKRHARFFAALAELKRRGGRLSGTLIGYPTDCQMADIAREAAHFGVLDQLELLEWVTPEEVNYHLNRTKVNVVWSRREGVNRVIIEGMYANIPCIVRDGFNYGYRYPYINSSTGRFATEAALPEVLMELLETHADYAPRDWVMGHMTCQKGTEIIGEAVRSSALERNEAWTSEPTVRVCHLNTSRYWNEEDRTRFASDYEFLGSVVKSARVADERRK